MPAVQKGDLMKANFSFTLTGRDWWKPFLGFWLLFLMVYIPEVTLPQWGLIDTGMTGVYFIVLLVFLVLLLVVQSIFTIVFLRIMLPKLSIDGKAFSFRGSVGKYLGMNLLGLLLSIVTLTIYLPWYMKRITAYLVSETGFDGAAPEFKGKGGRMFVYYLLGLWVPVIVICVLLALVFGVGFTSGSAPGMAFGALLTALLLVLVMPALCYLMYKWYVNLAWKDVAITWKTRFWPSVGMILGQILLTVITIGIYWPAAYLRLFRYFTARTVLSRGDQEIGRLGFEAKGGFGLLWGQALLSIITLGIYIPWACARVGRWISAGTYCETVEAPAQ
jgi:hypothetical protein